MDIIQTLIIIGGSAGLSLMLLALYMRRTLPHLITEVAETIQEAFTSTITEPMQKRAMSILGKESGRVRHDASAEKALAEGILSNMAPEIKIVLDQVAPNFIEEYGPESALALANKYAPLIERFLPQILGATKQKNITTKFGEF